MSRSTIKNITLYKEDLDKIDQAKTTNHRFNFSEFVRFALADENLTKEYLKTLK